MLSHLGEPAFLVQKAQNTLWWLLDELEAQRVVRELDMCKIYALPDVPAGDEDRHRKE